MADVVSAASCCSALVGFLRPDASCEGVAVMIVVKTPPDAGVPAANPMAVGKPLGSGERKNSPPLTAPLAAGPLIPPVSENAKISGIDAGVACYAS